MSESVQTTERRPTASPPATAGPTRARRHLISLVVMAALFFVGTVVMTVIASSLASELNQERDGRDGAAAFSSRFCERFLTYDATLPADAQRGVAALSTPKFRAEYTQAVAKVRAALEVSKSRAHATVTGVFVGDVDDDRASTVVTVDVVVKAQGEPERRQHQVLALTLVKAGRNWRVDEVNDLRANPPAPPAASP